MCIRLTLVEFYVINVIMMLVLTHLHSITVGVKPSYYHIWSFPFMQELLQFHGQQEKDLVSGLKQSLSVLSVKEDL